MLKVIVPLAALLLGGSHLQAQADPAAEAPRISVADAKKAVDSGKAILVDVRSAMQYEQEHLKGAISLPGYEMEKRISELPKDKQIITYCACSAEQTSAGSVLQLRQNGYQNAAALLGGIQAWKDAGYEVVKPSTP
jgi:rhodanese-related sulfurtransferase